MRIININAKVALRKSNSRLNLTDKLKFDYIIYVCFTNSHNFFSIRSSRNLFNSKRQRCYSYRKTVLFSILKFYI